MRWTAYFHPRFKVEFDEFSAAVQDELLASLVPLREYSPSLGRPEVDTLNDSHYANMKELRFKADGGVWRRLARRFCFRSEEKCNPTCRRRQIRSKREEVLQAADRKGDKRYTEHLGSL